tara:strand:+ start:89 stop:205 length:117 start_codon:yes stop_codon:yes gene_type:complete
MKFFKPLLPASASSAFAVDVTEFGAVLQQVHCGAAPGN